MSKFRVTVPVDLGMGVGGGYYEKIIEGDSIEDIQYRLENSPLVDDIVDESDMVVDYTDFDSTEVLRDEVEVEILTEEGLDLSEKVTKDINEGKFDSQCLCDIGLLEKPTIDSILDRLLKIQKEFYQISNIHQEIHIDINGVKITSDEIFVPMDEN